MADQPGHPLDLLLDHLKRLSARVVRPMISTGAYPKILDAPRLNRTISRPSVTVTIASSAMSRISASRSAGTADGARATGGATLGCCGITTGPTSPR